MSITYFHSALLNKKCKYDSETGIVTVQELSDLDPNKYIEYSKKECEILEYKTDPYIQKFKKMFGGEITEKQVLKMKGMI